MQKILKIIKFILLTIVISVGYFALDRYLHNPSQITPYPFSFEKVRPAKIEQANVSDVLIIGDKMGRALNPFIEQITEETSVGLMEKIKIFNWSQENESLARSLYKLKSLKKFPKIIIYHGATSELYEKTFYVANKRRIFNNFKLHDNDLILSVLMSFPIFSRFIYWPVQRINLAKEIKKDQNLYEGKQKLTQYEISFKIYSYLMQNLIELVRSKQSQLVIITTPVNLESKPKKVCDHATNSRLKAIQGQIRSQLEQGQTKEALSNARNLIENTPANAYSHYLLGKAYLNQAEYALAKNHLTLAKSFDCDSSGAHPVYNAIQIDKANQNNGHLIDFDGKTSVMLGRDHYFLDEHYVQNLFYNKLAKDIVKKIKLIFEL